LELPLRWKGPKRIFVNSMSDLFHENVPDWFIDAAFRTMCRGGQHQFQILTKRPERMAAYIGRRTEVWGELASTSPHIWLGTSVEAQDYVGRAAVVAELPCAVRFLSCEPLLGSLDLRRVLGTKLINWVIVGGESGRKPRPMEPLWVLDIRDQCREAGVPFFFKQWGGTNKRASGRVLENRTWDEYPVARSQDKQVSLFS
jgi:protein gp37